jgi:hypothetical protein
MAKRFYQSGGRIIMSRPGYDASPSLADNRKIFDSNWSFGASVIQAGSFAFSGWPIVINFPQQSYVPAAEVWADVDTEFFGSRGTMHLGWRVDDLPASRIYNNRIEVTNEHLYGRRYTPGRIFYAVYGLSL